MTTQKKRILIIEDEIDYLDIASQILKKEGFSVVTAVAGAEGLKELEKELPDLIILDIGLPDISGLDILKRLRSEERTSKIPVMLFTIRSELNEVADALKCGANDYILKPFDVVEFAKRIQAIFKNDTDSDSG